MSDKFTLRYGTETKDVKHAVPSGRARVELAKVDATETIDPKQRKLIEAMLDIAQGIRAGDQEVERTTAQAIQDLVRSGAMTIDEVVAMQTNATDPAKVEAQVKRTFQLFRIAADTAALGEGWQERIADDDFLADQDIAEMEAFITSFRAKVAGR